MLVWKSLCFLTRQELMVKRRQDVGDRGGCGGVSKEKVRNEGGGRKEPLWVGGGRSSEEPDGQIWSCLKCHLTATCSAGYGETPSSE